MNCLRFRSAPRREKNEQAQSSARDGVGWFPARVREFGSDFPAPSTRGTRQTHAARVASRTLHWPPRHRRTWLERGAGPCPQLHAEVAEGDHPQDAHVGFHEHARGGPGSERDRAVEDATGRRDIHVQGRLPRGEYGCREKQCDGDDAPRGIEPYSTTVPVGASTRAAARIVAGRDESLMPRSYVKAAGRAGSRWGSSGPPAAASQRSRGDRASPQGRGAAMIIHRQLAAASGV